MIDGKLDKLAIKLRMRRHFGLGHAKCCSATFVVVATCERHVYLAAVEKSIDQAVVAYV